MQQGMLFHGMFGQHTGVDIEQIECALDEALDPIALERAWQRTVDRHAILRTAYRWEGLPEPLQEVHRHLTVRIERLDWRDVSARHREAQWAEVLGVDRRRGFDLTRPPLMRFLLIRLDARSYRLLWTFHHSLLDGRSFPLVLREVFTVYAALRDGRDLELSSPRPYRDYIVWLQGRSLAPAEAFWRETLKGFKAPTPLVVARDVTDVRSLEPSGAFEVRLSGASTSRARAFVEAHDLTLNTLLQGAWAMLLHRYSGEEDIVFGATRACRRSALEGGESAESMVGLFINTLPLRVRVEPRASVVPWLRGLRAQQGALRDHEHTPLVNVQGWSDVPRGTALFESIVVFENYLLDSALRSLGGEWEHRRFRYTGQTNYPVTVIGYADPELLIRLEYDRHRLDDDAAERMLGHLVTLLEEVSADPDRALWQLPILTAAERHGLAQWGARRTDVAPVGCIHQRFEAQVARTPEGVALVCEGRSLTYRELNRRANRLAHTLRSLGVGPDVLVGLFVNRSAEMIVGILGILKAGGAYVPLDPAYPPDRVRFMLEDCAAEVLVTRSELVSKLPGCAASLVQVDALDAAPEPGPPDLEDDPVCRTASDHLAYVIYTSGSTGNPKGVLISHGNVVRLLDATRDWFHFGPEDVWTLFHSFAFDFSVWEMWGPLFHGGRLVIVPYWVSRSPEAFLELLQRERVTVLNQTPSAFRQLIQVEGAGPDPTALSLRLVVFGGEALELQSLRPWFARHGDRHPQLVNMYGITETTVHATYRPIFLADLESGSGSVIGEPIPDLEVHVLDQHRQPVPIGVPGELYVGGAGLARGYLRRPELTAERFVDHPFTACAGARLYRSGDLVRYLANGDLEYLGRMDHQVKIRGFRIELGEIESVLSQHPAVREAVVVAWEDTPGNKRLVAYVVTDGAESAIVDELRNVLRAKLPDYMVPSTVVRLPALPLTANGKVDRKALPKLADLDEDRRDLGARHVPPRNPVEESLSRIWGSVLDVKRVGIHDNFFELGGDSILSIQVIARGRQAGLQLSPKQLFRYPTIAELAAVCAPPAMGGKGEEVPAGAVPLTPIQEWFFEQRLEERHHWNQAFLFEVPGPLDADAMEAALNRVILHHDALRLTFDREGDRWRQHLGEETGAITLVRVDLSDLPEPEREAALVAAASELQSSIDLTRGPLARAAHFQLGPDRPGRLLLVVHHLVVDGVSWRILLEDLESAYLGVRAGSSVQLPAKSTSFQRWAERLVTHAGSPDLRRELAHWLSITSARPAVPPPDVDPPGENLESSAETVTVSLQSEETQALLRVVPAAYHTQINDVLLTALTQACEEWTAGEPLLIDLEGHGREEIGEDVDLSRTVGWFTTIFPVALECPRGSAPGEALTATKEQLRRVPGHGLGYGVLRYLSGDPAVVDALCALPRAEVVFNYLGQWDQVVEGSRLFQFASEPCGPWHSPRAARRHRLEVLALITGGRLVARWTFSRHVHRRITIERAATSFVSALRALIRHCQAPGVGGHTPSDFPLARVDQDTLDGLLHEHGPVEDIYPLSPMQQLFYSMEASQSKPGFEQWQFTLHGPLDGVALRKAWARVVSRHPILRTVFASKGLPEPLQLVLPEVGLPWVEHDWRGLSESEREERLAILLREDRDLGFDPSRPPLTRITLVRTGDERYHLVWSTHHLQVDGWSWPLVFKDLSAFYLAERRGQIREPEPVCPYRRYVEWLDRRGNAEAEAFWRRAMADRTVPTPLPGERSKRALVGREPFGEVAARLGADVTRALRTLARRGQLTLNTVVQGAWGLLLGHYAGEDDVVFGAAYSGRPAEVAGIEGMVGPCVTNLPVRIGIRRDEPLRAWLAGVQAQQLETVQYQYASTLQIQAWSGVPWRLRLFDSLLVFQNYLVNEAVLRLDEAVAVRTVAAPEATNYPLTLVVVAGPELSVKLLYHRDRLEERVVDEVLDGLRSVLETMAGRPGGSVTDILAVLPTAAAGSAIRAVKRAPSREERQAHVAPRTEMERKIAAIWRELFQLEDVDLDENFFELGGHSVLMIQAHTRLRQLVPGDLPIVALFQYPTVASLARYLSQEQALRPTARDFRARALQQQEAAARQRRSSGRG